MTDQEFRNASVWLTKHIVTNSSRLRILNGRTSIKRDVTGSSSHLQRGSVSSGMILAVEYASNLSMPALKAFSRKMEASWPTTRRWRCFYARFAWRYVHSIPQDFKCEETIMKLKKLLKRQTSLANARYQCIQYVKNDADDFSSYPPSTNIAKCSVIKAVQRPIQSAPVRLWPTVTTASWKQNNRLLPLVMELELL